MCRLLVPVVERSRGRRAGASEAAAGQGDRPSPEVALQRRWGIFARLGARTRLDESIAGGRAASCRRRIRWSAPAPAASTRIEPADGQRPRARTVVLPRTAQSSCGGMGIARFPTGKRHHHHLRSGGSTPRPARPRQSSGHPPTRTGWAAHVSFRPGTGVPVRRGWSVAVRTRTQGATAVPPGPGAACERVRPSYPRTCGTRTPESPRGQKPPQDASSHRGKAAGHRRVDGRTGHSRGAQRMVPANHPIF